MKTHRPNPQNPFNKSPNGTYSILNSIPFKGITTAKATKVGPTAPKTMDRMICDLREIPDTNFQINIPHSPPKKAAEMTLGIPNGSVGVML